MGAVLDQSLKDEVRITVVATGFPEDSDQDPESGPIANLMRYRTAQIPDSAQSDGNAASNGKAIFSKKEKSPEFRQSQTTDDIPEFMRLTLRDS